MQISRLFEIVYILLNNRNRQVTAQELAQRFEVSTRTIYRDVEVLCQAGVPLYTTKGKGGGIRLMEQYVLGRSMLSEREQVDILSALQGLEAVGATAGADKLLSKLSALFRKDMDSWIQVDFTDWSGSQTATFQALQAAILHRKEVSFHYYSSAGEQTQRTVRPIQLWFKHRGWYLRGFCLERQAERLFRLSRVKELWVSDREFAPLPLAPPPEDPQPPLETLPLALRIHPSQAYRVYDEFEPDQLSQDEAGYYLVEARYPEGEWVYGYLLSFSQYLEVLSPGWVREELGRRAGEIAKIYQDSPV